MKTVINGVSLDIPAKYILGDLPSSIVGKEGLDNAIDAIAISIPMEDLGIGEADGTGLQRNINVSIFEPDAYVKTHGMTMDALNAWTGRGVYDDRVVKKSSEYYKVGSKAGYPLLFHYFSSNPNSGGSANNVWMASCSGSNTDRKICKRHFVIGDIQIRLSFSSHDIKRFSLIEERLRALIQDWKSS